MLKNSLLSSWITPNGRPVKPGILIAALIATALGLWYLLKPTVFPSPVEVLLALPGLWSDGVADAIFSSLMVNLEALLWSTLLGLPLAYLSRVPLIFPVAQFVGKLRFVGSAIFFLPLLLLLPTGHAVKVWLIALGQLFYLVTTLTGVVQSIPEAQFDDARTLRMGEWISIWYVVVRGTVAETITAIKDNAAVGWSMLMFVEGVIRSEGGIGVVILNAQKYVKYDEFFAAVLLIILVGIGQDRLLVYVRKVAAPYAN